MKKHYPYEIQIESRLSRNDFDEILLWCMDRFGLPSTKNEATGSLTGDWMWDKWPKDKNMSMMISVFAFKNEEDYTLFTLTWG